METYPQEQKQLLTDREVSMNIEETFKTLDDILNRLEDKDTSLEDAFKEYEKGMKLVKECNDSLDKVEKKIQLIRDDMSIESVERDELRE